LSAQEGAQVDGLFDALVRCVVERGIAVSAPAAPAEIPSAPVAESSKLIYLFADSGSWAEPLRLQLEGCGYEVRIFADSAELLGACIEHSPAAVITDVSLAVGDWQGAQMAARLRDTLRTPPPAIFVCDRDDLDARLRAARAGGVAYFTRPLKFTALMDKLDELSVHASPEPYRVMIVEDAEEQALLCSTVLRQSGMLTCVVSDPQQLLAQLAEFHPDLVLMDMYLPGCTGDELARIVRQIEPFVGVPIVFLSVESDFDRQLTAMGLGGDEFLTKPILPAQLVSIVGSRIQHYRRLRALMIQDGLTGLANHSRLQQVLETEVARALRQATPLTLVMIDIDDFKLINDRYGHPAGDRVLLALARFARQRLRLSDVVARYGGEEFAIVMANTEGPDAHTVIERLRSHFATLVHEGDQGETFSVTFSAGIAAIAGHGSARALLLAADRSLYSAKERGRNCVVLEHAARP
jgi:diguanylate cyclase (GGDEF)-like protein